MPHQGKQIIALAAALAAFHTGAQTLSDVCDATDPADPDYDIADYDPLRDADDFCKLAQHEPHKARRQFNKAVAMVRRFSNPNRFYFDPRHGADAGFIQLRRDWMAEAGWMVRHFGEFDSGQRVRFRDSGGNESDFFITLTREIYEEEPALIADTPRYRALVTNTSWFNAERALYLSGQNGQIKVSASETKRRVESLLDCLGDRDARDRLHRHLESFIWTTITVDELCPASTETRVGGQP